MTILWGNWTTPAINDATVIAMLLCVSITCIVAVQHAPNNVRDVRIICCGW